MRCAACLKSEAPCSSMLKVPKVQDCMFIWCFTFFPPSSFVNSYGCEWWICLRGLHHRWHLKKSGFGPTQFLFAWMIPVSCSSETLNDALDLRCFSAAGIANGARSWIVENVECMVFCVTLRPVSCLFEKCDHNMMDMSKLHERLCYIKYIMYYELYTIYHILYTIYILYRCI